MKWRLLTRSFWSNYYIWRAWPFPLHLKMISILIRKILAFSRHNLVTSWLIWKEASIPLAANEIEVSNLPPTLVPWKMDWWGHTLVTSGWMPLHKAWEHMGFKNSAKVLIANYRLERRFGKSIQKTIAASNSMCQTIPGPVTNDWGSWKKWRLGPHSKIERGPLFRLSIILLDLC